MIKSLFVKNFRNHQELSLSFEKFNYIEGLNGSGKTSLLEALYYVSLLKSFRTSDDKNLIKSGSEYAKVIVKTTNDNYEVVLTESSKFLKRNNKVITKMSEFIGGYKVVIFSLEDLMIIRGFPKERRMFMDIEMSQVTNSYLKNLTVYKQVLKERNALLKQLSDGDDLTFLKIITKRLSLEADLIITKRAAFLKDLNSAFKKHFKRLNEKDGVSIIYEPDVGLNSLEVVLNEELKKELITKTTTRGPHRDDFMITFNGKLAKTHASGGQQRLIMIALKIALLDLLKDEVVILLDDVLSELDLEVKKMIENIFKETKQVIMTGTDNNYYEINNIYLERKSEDGSK
ncbi:MAG: DNA replication and repair protein RecF [Acholeplasmataceae bacterium]|nr:DNA replication and repair protein RecF [Acholeplasmataceae bacterium]